MSDAGQFAAAGRSEGIGADAAVRPSSGGAAAPGVGGSAKRPGPWRQLMVMAAGGLISGGLVVGAFGLVHQSQPGASGLQMVAATDIDEASLSLDSNVARTAAEEAKQCKMPLAYVTLLVDPGHPAASVRIRSGSYLSPSISVANAPRRVAIPFPAPYASGQGAISIEGTARGLNVWLSPVIRFDALDGARPISVHWTPKTPPC
jgi:hypothetical protein